MTWHFGNSNNTAIISHNHYQRTDRTFGWMKLRRFFFYWNQAHCTFTLAHVHPHCFGAHNFGSQILAEIHSLFYSVTRGAGEKKKGEQGKWNLKEERRVLM